MERKMNMTQELMEHLEVLRMQTNRSYNTCESVYERSYYNGYASAIADLKRWIQKKMEAKEQTVGDVKL